MLHFNKLIIIAFITAIFASSTVNARSVDDLGSDLGYFGDLINAPVCEFIDKEAAKCNCLEKKDEKCIKYAVCECTDEKDNNCKCLKKNEEPRKLTVEEVKELIQDKLVKLIKGRKIGKIKIDDEKAFVFITELSGAPFYKVTIDRLKGREMYSSFKGKNKLDTKSKIGKTTGQR